MPLRERPEHRVMVGRIARSLLRNEVMRGSATALAMKFAAALLGFAMFALLSRRMEPHAFGATAIVFNAMAFLSVAALCGQETLIVRSWEEYCQSGRTGLARGALTFGIQVTLAAVALVTTAVALVWSFWNPSEAPALMLAACAFLFCHALVQFSGQFARVAGGLIVAEGPRELLWRLIVVVAIGIYHVNNVALGAVEFFLITAGALTLAMVVQVVQVARMIPATVRQAPAEFDIAAWLPRSFKMWLAALLDTTSQYLEVVAVGLVLGPAAAGFYFVATRITNVFAMIAGSMTTYVMPQISGLFYSNAKDELQRVLGVLAVTGAALVGATFLLIAVAGKLLLAMFGAAYVPVYPALLVLALGAAIGALVGPAPHILLLTGHEGTYPRIMALGLLGRFLMIAVLGHVFGLMGVVVATAVSTVFIALCLLLACRRLVGLDPSLGFSLGRTQGRPAES